MIRSMPKFDTHSARPGRAATQQEHDASARSARALQALPVGSVQNSRGAAWQLPKWADRKPCACARKNCVWRVEECAARAGQTVLRVAGGE